MVISSCRKSEMNPELLGPLSCNYFKQTSEWGIHGILQMKYNQLVAFNAFEGGQPSQLELKDVGIVGYLQLPQKNILLEGSRRSAEELQRVACIYGI